MVEALTPLGTSVAGAIVCASLFFVAGVAAVAYFFYTSKLSPVNCMLLHYIASCAAMGLRNGSLQNIRGTMWSS